MTPAGMGRPGSSCQPGPNVMRLMEAVALMVKLPRTAQELAEAMGLDPGHEQAYRYLHAMHGEGLVYVREWVPRGPARQMTALWAWQSDGVAVHPDAPRPVAVAPPRNKRQELPA